MRHHGAEPSYWNEDARASPLRAAEPHVRREFRYAQQQGLQQQQPPQHLQQGVQPQHQQPQLQPLPNRQQQQQQQDQGQRQALHEEQQRQHHHLQQPLQEPPLVVQAMPAQGPSWLEYGMSSLEVQQQQVPLVLHAQQVPLPQHHGVLSLHEMARTVLFPGKTMTELYNDYRQLQNAVQDMHMSIEKLSSQLAGLSQHNPAQSLAVDNAAAASRDAAAPPPPRKLPSS